MQIEQAWWFYEDFYADVYAGVPHVKTLNNFGKVMFTHSELLRHYKDQVLKVDTLDPRLNRWLRIFTLTR